MRLADGTLYFDHAASMPCDPDVVEAMLPWFSGHFANPHSAGHQSGARAAEAIEAARAEVAALIGAQPREVIFTSGATEANNLAIGGAAKYAGPDARRRVITAATEHPCVLESVRDLASAGFEPVVLPVQPDGRVDPEALRRELHQNTLLVSVMAVNNETGILERIAHLAAIAHEHSARFHSDLAQAAGKIPVDVESWNLDAASLSAHKLNGPKGIGALYLRRHPRMHIAPLFSGGGQERGLRSGTLPTPLVVGFGVAARLARQRLLEDSARLTHLRETFLSGLASCVSGLRENGAGPHAPHILNLRFPGVSATDLIEACPELALSTGSACSSAAIAPSRVLLAMGLAETEARASLRVSFGRSTAAADVGQAVALLGRAYAHLVRYPVPA